MENLSTLDKVSDESEKLYKLARDETLPHAILIESNDINNKALKLAVLLAEVLVCLSEDLKKPCKRCSACKKVKLNVHPDVKIVSVKNGYKSIRADDIRQIRLDAYLSPNESNYKIYIISDIALMNEQAQNIFLKILEDPPEKVKFIILCTSRFFALPTVMSRAQIFSIDKKSDLETENSFDEILDETFKILGNGNKLDLLKLFSKFTKDKEAFSKFLDELNYKISEFCILKAKNFSKSDSKEEGLVSILRLIKIQKEIINTKELVDKNVNLQLIICSFCYKLMR